MSFEPKPASSIAPQNEANPRMDKGQDNDNEALYTPLSVSELWAMRLPQPYVIPLCGGIAGAVAGIVSCPLDVIKTKLQAQGGFRLSKETPKLTTAAYRGVYGTARMIWTEEGLRGLYRGLGPMLLGYVPTWAVYLTVYNKTQAYFRTKTDNWFLANVYASLSGGTCSTLATNPIWVIKTRLMSQAAPEVSSKHSRPPWQYRNTLDAARKMYRNEGILSFYSGLTPALLGLTHVAIQFPLYEVFKAKFTGLGPGAAETDEDRAHHFYGLSLAIFLSKVCASTATYPHEVVRTRLQTQQRSTFNHSHEGISFSKGPEKSGVQTASRSGDGLRYRGTIQCCKAILVEEGWRGFYAGLGTNLLRAVPSAMTTILTFEYLKKTMNQLRQEGQAKLDTLGSPVA